MTERGKRMSGFAEEARPEIDVQISVHAEAGWDSIELRTVNGKNVCEVDDATFDGIYRRMMDAGMRASCFGSPIANWARPITTPFEKDVEDLKRAIPRMRLLQTNMIRVMSYPNAQWPDEDWRREVFRRFTELVKIAEGEAVVMVLENCDGWASESPQNFKTMLETFNSSALRVVYDTGNTVSHKGTKEQTWEFYKAALPYIVHFHIKDCKLVDGLPVHTYPGEGDSDVLAIMKDLHSRNYTGMYSIEPHIHTQVHLKESTTPAQKQLEMYRTYTRMANTLFDQLLL
jgi:sugar phosphate isomerase/epimerase